MRKKLRTTSRSPSLQLKGILEAFWLSQKLVLSAGPEMAPESQVSS